MAFKLVFGAVVGLTILTVTISYQLSSLASSSSQETSFTRARWDMGGTMFTQRVSESERSGGYWSTQRSGDQERSVYLMALTYSGQQAAGINAFSSFQCWAAYLAQPVRIVEPVIRRSRLASSFDANPEAMGLGDFFDMEHLNRDSIASGYPTVTARKKFLEHGPRDVVFIDVNGQSSKEVVVWSADDNVCYSSGQSKKQVNRILQYNYCIRKIVNIKASLLTRNKFWQILGSWNRWNVTVIVSNWKGPQSPQVDCKHMGKESSKSQFHPSPRLLADASAYIHSYYTDRSVDYRTVDYNTVMIRLERVAMLTEQFPSKGYSIQACLQQVADIERKEAANTSKPPIITADIGQYGSHSWDWAVKDKQKLATGIDDTKGIMQKLLGNQTSLEKWERTFVEAAGGETDRGYIAALQRTIASQSKCLILMGGGNFQDLALQEYLRVHSGDRKGRCVHLVCTVNEETMRGRMSRPLADSEDYNRNR